MIGSYGFKHVVCLIDGTPQTGFADGDSPISIERNVDAFSLLVGADGEQAALFNADKSGVAILQFLQTSRSNAFLSAKLKIQDAGQLSPFPFAVKDTKGLDLAIAESAFVVGPPRLVYGQGHNAREWRLVLGAVEIFAAGVA